MGQKRKNPSSDMEKILNEENFKIWMKDAEELKKQVESYNVQLKDDEEYHKDTDKIKNAYVKIEKAKEYFEKGFREDSEKLLREFFFLIKNVSFDGNIDQKLYTNLSGKYPKLEEEHKDKKRPDFPAIKISPVNPDTSKYGFSISIGTPQVTLPAGPHKNSNNSYHNGGYKPPEQEDIVPADITIDCTEESNNTFISGNKLARFAPAISDNLPPTGPMPFGNKQVSLGFLAGYLNFLDPNANFGGEQPQQEDLPLSKEEQEEQDAMLAVELADEEKARAGRNAEKFSKEEVYEQQLKMAIELSMKEQEKKQKLESKSEDPKEALKNAVEQKNLDAIEPILNDDKNNETVLSFLEDSKNNISFVSFLNVVNDNLYTKAIRKAITFCKNAFEKLSQKSEVSSTDKDLKDVFRILKLFPFVITQEQFNSVVDSEDYFNKFIVEMKEDIKLNTGQSYYMYLENNDEKFKENFKKAKDAIGAFPNVKGEISLSSSPGSNLTNPNLGGENVRQLF